MRKVIKIEDWRKVWICSDLHYGHDKSFLFYKRGFASIVNHDIYLREQWHKLIGPDDIVINCGDICFKDPEGRLFTEISRWPCHAHYVMWGNHNSGMKKIFKDLNGDFEVYPTEYNNIVFVGEDLTFKYKNQTVYCSHFPKLIWDNIGKGAWHLSGHSHGSHPDRLPSSKTLGKTLDVGVEVALNYNASSPYFIFDDIKKIMDTKPIRLFDHHDANTTSSS